jgi:hypothetical protein
MIRYSSCVAKEGKELPVSHTVDHGPERPAPIHDNE